LTTYWQHVINHLESETHDYKLHQLPLARIKKVMKADPEVKMISAEAPILFAKGCDIFITELTMRAWIHAEENKRRTLQRSDIASALAKSDMFDFLIDIVPREEASHAKRAPQGPATSVPTSGIPPQNLPQPGQHPHNSMPPPDYGSIHNMPSDNYGRNTQDIYQPGVQTNPPQYAPHPQQVYQGGIDEIYGYPSMQPSMQPQQVFHPSISIPPTHQQHPS
jgi:nuclear transcription factor Y gamma